MRVATGSGKRTQGRLRLIAASLVVGLASVALAVVPAQVASAAPGHTYYVNSATDTGSVTDCTTSTNTDCGIDDAIAAFNADTTPNDADTIVFNSSIATSTVSTPTAIKNTTTGVTLAINGNGSSSTAVSGGGTKQVFNIATGTTVTVAGLTIEMGNGVGLGGGGIFNNGTVTVTDSTLSGNHATNYGGGIVNVGTATMNVTDSRLSGNRATDGGGIFNDGGTVTLTDSTLSNESATNYGGGILNDGTATMTDSTLSNDTAAAGGGILNDGTAAMTDSSLSNDGATEIGGGILNDGTATMTDSTLSNDTAAGGGGILNSGTVTLTDGTLSGNSSAASGGGGISNSGTVNLGATIVANSTSGDDCYNGGTVNDEGYNIDDDGTCGFSATGSISASATLDASLGMLQNNGGPTQTILPAANSPAVGVIPSGTTLNSDSVCPRTDQRGVPSVGKCTIGAVEGGFLVTTASLPNATPGTAYGPVTLTTQEAGVSASPYTTTLKWKKVGHLPKGLKLSKTGVLSGTPSTKLKAGMSSVKVSVTETVTTRNGKKKVKTKTTVQATIPLTIT